MSEKLSPTPWTYENVSERSERSGYAVVKDATGKVLFDTLNSDVACISTEHDEGSVTYADEQGRVNLTLAAAAPDHALLLRAITEGQAVLSVIGVNLRVFVRGELFTVGYDAFGCPLLTPELRDAMLAARNQPRASPPPAG